MSTRQVDVQQRCRKFSSTNTHRSHKSQATIARIYALMLTIVIIINEIPRQANYTDSSKYTLFSIIW